MSTIVLRLPVACEPRMSRNARLQRRLRANLETEKAKPYACDDCGRRAHPYMVRDTLWIAAGMTYATGAHYLCFRCLEKRLGRHLRETDFPTPHPINCWLRWPRRELMRTSVSAAWRILAKFQGRARYSGRNKLIMGSHVIDLAQLDALCREANELGYTLCYREPEGPTCGVYG